MAKQSKNHITKHKKRKKIATLRRNVLILVVLIIIVINIMPKSKSTEIALILNNEEITESLSEKLFNADNIVYMSYADVSKYIDKTIYKENENTIITTSIKKVACLDIGNNTITINGAEKKLGSGPIRVNEKIFLPISELESVYDIDFEFSNTSNIAVIDNLSTQKKIATAKKKVSIKKDKNIFSKTLCKVRKDEKVVYIHEEGTWSRVMSKEGYIGYVKTSNLIDIETEREEFKIEEKITNDSNYLEKDVSKIDISSFKKRQELVQSILLETIKKDKTQIKIIGNAQEEGFKRLVIEAIPIFNECGLKCEFE